MNVTQLAQYTGWLVASQNERRFNDVAEQFQNSTQISATQISATQVVVFCVGALILGVVLWRVARVVAMRDGRSYTSPKRLFQQLCQLHELDWPSRRLLRRLAHARQLKHPARLFLEPAWFEAAELPVPLRPSAPQLAEIRQRLFD